MGLLKILSIVELVLGLLCSGVVSSVAGKPVDRYSDRNMPVTLGVFIGGLFITILIFALLDAAARMLDAQEGIYEILARMEERNKVTDENKSLEVVEKNQWKCPKCGKINFNYNTTCQCGQSKD